MALPEHLERLKHISIDTLGLSDSTLAVLKWYSITHVVDCIAFFYKSAQDRNASRSRSRLSGLMFGELKPALIAGGYWDLVLDAEVWQVFREQKYELAPRRVVRWQGQDINLYEIPFEELGITETQQDFQVKTVGHCIDYFLYFTHRGSRYWLERDRPPDEMLFPHTHIFEVVQPRLAELGLWAFVEAHYDDFEADDNEVEWHELDGGSDGWEPFEGEDLPIHHVLLKLLSSPIRWIARTLRQRRRRAD